MLNTPQPQPDSPQPTIYRIRIKGQLDSQWTDWFEGLAITLEENGETLLTGPVVDQAALHGVLKRIRDLGMPLVSVCPVSSQENRSNSSKEGDKK
ncbi:MAG: hypothetical protein CVU39_19445 [Chloroflexi bacterium HGW-Chloroflexi-10]|nr:MAG: hypothetical protein CVU39_19445 [Chloroflexi bacterium HGW-Chloroflexi-10]